MTLNPSPEAVERLIGSQPHQQHDYEQEPHTSLCKHCWCVESDHQVLVSPAMLRALSARLGEAERQRAIDEKLLCDFELSRLDAEDRAQRDRTQRDEAVALLRKVDAGRAGVELNDAMATCAAVRSFLAAYDAQEPR